MLGIGECSDTGPRLEFIFSHRRYDCRACHTQKRRNQSRYRHCCIQIGQCNVETEAETSIESPSAPIQSLSNISIRLQDRQYIDEWDDEGT